MFELIVLIAAESQKDRGKKREYRLSYCRSSICCTSTSGSRLALFLIARRHVGMWSRNQASERDFASVYLPNSAFGGHTYASTKALGTGHANVTVVCNM